MRISFSGAHRTGKTTLAERVALEMFCVFQETALKKLIGTPNQPPIAGKEGALFLMNKQDMICDHICGLIDSSEPWTVFDRSPFDVYCYSEMLFGKLLTTFVPDEDVYDSLNNHLNRTSGLVDKIDVHFIVQPGIEFGEAFQSFDEESQLELADIFLNAKSNGWFNTEIFVVPKEMTNLEERVEWCVEILEKYIDIPQKPRIM